MSCATCGHTMALLSLEPRTFWCSRCGSILQSDGEGEKSQAPKLVERCREFWMKLIDKHPSEPRHGLPGLWNSLGVAEAIYLPKDRGLLKPGEILVHDEEGVLAPYDPNHTEEELKGGTE